MRGGIFEVADISLCSGLQVCSPPRSSLPLRILPQGSRGFYVRAERGSLPPRASDMLTARRQAIGGAGTCTPLDCGLVGCSFPSSPLRFRTAGFPRYGSKAGLSDRAFPDRAAVKIAPIIPVAWYKFASILRAPPAAAWSLRSVSESTCSGEHRHASDLHRSTPGVLAPVQVVLSWSIIT